MCLPVCAHLPGCWSSMLCSLPTRTVPQGSNPEGPLRRLLSSPWGLAVGLSLLPLSPEEMGGDAVRGGQAPSRPEDQPGGDARMASAPLRW